MQNAIFVLTSTNLSNFVSLAFGLPDFVLCLLHSHKGNFARNNRSCFEMIFNYIRPFFFAFFVIDSQFVYIKTFFQSLLVVLDLFSS